MTQKEIICRFLIRNFGSQKIVERCIRSPLKKQLSIKIHIYSKTVIPRSTKAKGVCDTTLSLEEVLKGMLQRERTLDSYLNQWEPWACFPATRWSHLGVIEDGDTQSVLLMSILLCNLVLIAVTAEIFLHKDRMLEMEATFSVLLWQSQHIPPWLQSRMEIWHCLKHTFKATIICNLKQLPLLACTRSIYLAYSQMGHWFIPSQFGDLL